MKAPKIAKRRNASNDSREWIKRTNASIHSLKKDVDDLKHKTVEIEKKLNELEEKKSVNRNANLFLVGPNQSGQSGQRAISHPDYQQNAAQNMQMMVAPLIATLNEVMNHSNNGSQQQRQPININFISLNQIQNKEYNKSQTLYNKNAPTIHEHAASPFARSNASSNRNHNNGRQTDEDSYFDGHQRRKYFNSRQL